MGAPGSSAPVMATYASGGGAASVFETGPEHAGRTLSTPISSNLILQAIAHAVPNPIEGGGPSRMSSARARVDDHSDCCLDACADRRAVLGGIPPADARTHA